MKSWQLATLIGLAVFLVSLPLVLLNLQKPQELRNRAAEPTPPPSTSISVIPATQAVPPGQPATVQVYLNTANPQVSGIKFRLLFDPQYLSAPQVTINKLFNSQISFGGAIIKDNYVEVALARSPGTTPYDKGSAPIASIVFTASSAIGITQLTFEPNNTQVFDTHTVSLLGATVPGTIQISTGVTPTPTSTLPTPTPTTTSSLTPTPTPEYLRVSTYCAEPHDEFDFQHMDVYVRVYWPFSPTLPDGTWFVIKDMSTGNIAYITYTSQGFAPSNYDFHNEILSHLGNLRFYPDGRQYMAAIFYAPYSEETPNLPSEPEHSVDFSLTCPFTVPTPTPVQPTPTPPGTGGGPDTVTITQATLEPLVKWLNLYTLTVEATSTAAPDAQLTVEDLRVWPLVPPGDYPMGFFFDRGSYYFSRWIFTIPQTITVTSNLGGSATIPVTLLPGVPQPTPTGYPTGSPGNATISVNPATQTVAPGNPVTVDLTLNPGQSYISGLGLRLEYQSPLSSPSVQLNQVFTNQQDFGGPIVSSDAIEIAIARNPGTEPYSGDPISVAQVTFSAPDTATGFSQLTITNAQVYDINTRNLLSAVYHGSVNFSALPGESAGPVDFSVKFRGIDQQSDDQYVRVTFSRGGDWQVFNNVLVTADPIGIYSGQLQNITVPAGSGYAFYVKGPKHLQKKFCSDGQASRCISAAGQITLASDTNTFDFSADELEPGDLPDPLLDWQQDGVVNAHDGSLLIDRLYSQEPDDLRIADLNLDGIVNAYDYTLLIETLSAKWEEDH